MPDTEPDELPEDGPLPADDPLAGGASEKALADQHLAEQEDAEAES